MRLPKTVQIYGKPVHFTEPRYVPHPLLLWVKEQIDNLLVRAIIDATKDSFEKK